MWVRSPVVSSHWHHATEEIDYSEWEENKRYMRRTRQAIVSIECGGLAYTEFEGNKWSMLAVKDTINLMQNNVCTNCRKKLLAKSPALAAAAELLKSVG